MFLNKREIKLAFKLPQKEPLAEEDYFERHKFLSGTISGSLWETKDYARDYIPFQAKFKVNWPALYERYKQDKQDKQATVWPCFDEPGKLEFVLQNKVLESLPLPNQYAQGPVAASAE